MSAYIIGHVTIRDPEGYKAYSSRTAASLAPHGGEFLVRGGRTTVMEGGMPHDRHIVIRFPDRASAEAWYNSAEYRELIPIRQANSTGVLIIADGYDG